MAVVASDKKESSDGDGKHEYDVSKCMYVFTTADYNYTCPYICI